MRLVQAKGEAGLAEVRAHLEAAHAQLAQQEAERALLIATTEQQHCDVDKLDSANHQLKARL